MHVPASSRILAAAQLPLRRLGMTEMSITPVGLGAWAMGGPDWASGWGDQNDDDSIATIRHAVELGINWIDTAPVYGLGHSEEIVARALNGIVPSRRPYVFTKCGLVWNESARTEVPRPVGAPQSIRRELESSLRRLRVERIDLYQMHVPPRDGASLDDYWSTLLDMRREGKVRAIGLSHHSVAELDSAERLGHVDTMQPALSAISREAASDVLPWCRIHGVGVIAYSPMHSGLLSGRFTVERAAALPKNDWRSRNREFVAPRLARNLALAEALRTIADRRGATVAAVAIAWVLAWPGVTGAIVGARQPAQINDWIAGGTLALSDADIHYVADAIRDTRAGRGPALPAGPP